MSVPRDFLQKEIDQRIHRTRNKMEERGYSSLLVYGNNKVFGSLRYLSDFFPALAGWVHDGAAGTHIFEGAILAIPSPRDEPVLLLDAGVISALRKEVCTIIVIPGGLFPEKIADLLPRNAFREKIGIETYDLFPAPLYLGLRKLLPDATFERSTVVEELRMVKSPLEIDLFRTAGKIGDLGHSVFVENLRNGMGKTELEITRSAEHAMRCADPIYEDGCNCSPSLICSGSTIAGNMLHLPDHMKKIERGNMVHWDITMRYEGYSIDTSRTKVVGKPTELQKRVYEIALEMSEKVIQAARPGIRTKQLIEIADGIARKAGYKLRGRFLGHGLGLDVHERPDIRGEEDTVLQANMVLAIEPRLHLGHTSVAGVEDMVWVTERGGVAFTEYEKTLDL